MKVLLVSDFYPPVAGGLEFHVDTLAGELARRGDEVAVATLTRDPIPSSGNVRVYTIPSLANRLPHERADRPFHPPVPDPVARRALGKLVDRFRPDVIHGHSWLTVSLPRGATPVVFTAHDYALACQLRTLVRSDGSICGGPDRPTCIACGAGSYGRVKSELMTRGTEFGARRLPMRRVLAVSAAVQRAIAPHVDVPVDVVSNFVGPAPDPVGLPIAIPEGSYAMYAGHGGADKGVPDLLEVWRHEPPALPLVLATPRGIDGPLPRNVISVSLSRAEVATAWRRAAFAIVPSRWHDPCPTVVLEAMRAGIPVIGTRQGGIPDLVEDGVSGLLIPPRDPSALRAAIHALVADPARLKSLGRASAARGEEFGVARVGERIRAIYEELVEQEAVS